MYVFPRAGKPTMATIVGEFFQFGFRFSLYGDEFDVIDPFGEPL